MIINFNSCDVTIKDNLNYNYNCTDTQIKINLSAVRHLHWRSGAHQLGTMMHAGIELRMPFMLSSSETQVFW